MMRIRKRISAVIFVFLLGLMTMPLTSHAQALQNSSQSVALSYSVGESITVSLTTPSIVLTTVDQPLTGTVTYTLAPTRTFIGYILYFNTTSALSSGSATIPASNLFVGDNPCNFTLANALSSMGVSGSSIFAGVPTGQQSVCSGANGAGQVVPLAGTYTGTQTINTTIKLGTAPTTFGNYTGTLQLLAAAL